MADGIDIRIKRAVYLDPKTDLPKEEIANYRLLYGEMIYLIDKDFLVIGKKENRVFLVNGKSRKVARPKIKNVKHVQSVLSGEMKSLAERINDGVCTGNERVRRELKTAVQIKTGGNVLCRKTT